ncbi:MAG: hypothetical protein J2P47_11245 [Acetobacteraceae bacterium]|nr:hypothetical protein [Acetobacteraceae bacterium]
MWEGRRQVALKARGRYCGGSRQAATREIDNVLDSFVGAVVGEFEAVVRPMLGIWSVVKAAVGERSAQALMKEQEEQRDLSAFCREEIVTTRATARKRIKRKPGRRMVDGKSFRLADEIDSIQRRAAEHDGRIVTIGQLVLFSTETGDAWLLGPADHLAARLGRGGDPEPIHIEELNHFRD